MADYVYSKDKWIIEGTTQWLFESGIDDADVILYLKFKTIFHQWFFLIKRSLKRDNEKFTDLLKLLRHVFYKRFKLGYKKNSVTHQEVIEPYLEKVIVLDSFKEIDSFDV